MMRPILSVLFLSAATLPAQRFAEIPTFPGSRAEPTLVIAGDVDGDQDLDLFDTVHDGPNALWIGDGEGRFAAGDFPTEANDAFAAAFVDVDGDGDLDLFVATAPDFEHFLGQNLLYLNDGQGRFTDVTATHLPRDMQADVAVEVGDVDGDGDQDIVVGALDWWSYGLSGQPRLYRNDGSGRFVDDTAALPVHEFGDSSSLVLADIDGDLAPDLLVGGGRRLQVWMNDGRGRFADETSARAPWALSAAEHVICVLDADGDGDLDLVKAPQHGTASLHRNDGRGFFAAADPVAMPPVQVTGLRSLVVGDADMDGDDDLLLVSDRGHKLLVQEGDGFVDATADIAPAAGPCATFADIDRDSDHDVVGAGQPLLNRTRQLLVPQPPVVGGTLVLEAFAEPGSARWPTIVVPVIAAHPFPIPLPVPGLGLVRIDPASAVPLPMFVAPTGSGLAELHVALPPDPALTGARGFVQAAFVPLDPWSSATVSSLVDVVVQRS